MKAWETAVTTLDKLFSTVTSATLLERLKPLYVLVKERKIRKFRTFMKRFQPPTIATSNRVPHKCDNPPVIVPCDCTDCQLRWRLCFMHQQLQINRTLVPCNSYHWVCLPLVTIKEQPGDKPGEDPQVRKRDHMETQRNAVNSNSSMTRRTAPNTRTC